jgi:anti-anti-sigma factor
MVGRGSGNRPNIHERQPPPERKPAMKVCLKPDNDLVQMAEWDRFSRDLIALVDRGFDDISIDFENVHYVNSSTIGTLVSAHQKQTKNGRRLSVTNLNDELRTLFSHMHLERLFT